MLKVVTDNTPFPDIINKLFILRILLGFIFLEIGQLPTCDTSEQSM